MPARLIINADDFGLTNGINRAVEDLHRSGALSSATLMANGGRFEQAKTISRANPALGVGCHVVLTDGQPLSAPETIPTLIGSDGRSFRTSLMDFWRDVLLGRIDSRDVEREAEAQIRKLLDAGIHVTHLDTHKHSHILPSVAGAILRTAERLGVRAVRNPFEHSWSLKLSHGSIKRQFQVRLMSILRKRFEALPQIVSGAVVTTDGTIGISATGHLDTKTLNVLLQHIPDGTWELVTHPGYSDAELDAITTRLRATRDVEREALMSAFREGSAHRLPIELIHYGMLPEISQSSAKSLWSSTTKENEGPSS